MANLLNTPYYNTDNPTANRSNNFEGGLPVISEGLDSVRAYQFEMHLVIPGGADAPGGVGPPAPGGHEKLTLACKQVTAAGFSTEDIEVHRVNDKVFYPGKASPEELTVTFDNLYQPQIANTLWNWFSSIYDPMSGKFNANSADKPPRTGWKAQRATIVSLDAHGQPLMETRLFGVYPKSWKTAEFNYSTNDFHTIEVVFRYDFMEHVSYTT
jgi:hypothetical protein